MFLTQSFMVQCFW